MNLLSEHLQTRLGHRKPHAVHSVTVFCDFKFKSMLSPSTVVSHWSLGHSNSHHRICPIPEQHSSCNDLIASKRYMGASPQRIGKPPRFSAVHDPWREHCRVLVQAFSLWRAGSAAGIEQRRKWKLKSIASDAASGRIQTDFSPKSGFSFQMHPGVHKTLAREYGVCRTTMSNTFRIHKWKGKLLQLQNSIASCKHSLSGNVATFDCNFLRIHRAGEPSPRLSDAPGLH